MDGTQELGEFCHRACLPAAGRRSGAGCLAVARGPFVFACDSVVPDLLCSVVPQDGRTYYYNKATKKSSWDKPPEMKTPGEAACPWKEYTSACLSARRAAALDSARAARVCRAVTSQMRQN